MIRAPLRERVQGRWAAILPLLGLGREYLSGKHGPCPFCGGKDRWRWINREGSGDWVCNQCGHGSGIDLAIRLLGDFRAAAERIETLIERAPQEERRDKRDEKTLKLAMIRLWDSGVPITAGDPAGRYLASRGIAVDVLLAERRASSLRYCARARYDQDRRFPAMLAKVANPDNRAINIHRTFLTEEGRKAPVDPVRKMMPGAVPAGSAIRLGPAGARLGIAEGIESALSASALFGVTTWAAIDAGKLAKFLPPEGVEELVVFGDNDENMTGQAVSFTLARLLVGRGCGVVVEIPPRPGTDWNDVIRANGANNKGFRAESTIGGE